MTKENMKKSIYELYQLHWLMNHGYSLSDAMFRMAQTAYAEGLYEDSSVVDCLSYEKWTDILHDWQEEGFRGEMFACFEEFLETEYLEKDYVLFLLSQSNEKEELKRLYLEDLENNS